MSFHSQHDLESSNPSNARRNSSRSEIARLFLLESALDDDHDHDHDHDTSDKASEDFGDNQSRYSDFSSNRHINERIVHSLWSCKDDNSSDDDDGSICTNSSSINSRTESQVFAARLVDLSFVDQSINLMDAKAGNYEYEYPSSSIASSSYNNNKTNTKTHTTKIKSRSQQQQKGRSGSDSNELITVGYAVAGMLLFGVMFLLSWIHMQQAIMQSNPPSPTDETAFMVPTMGPSHTTTTMSPTSSILQMAQEERPQGPPTFVASGSTVDRKRNVLNAALAGQYYGWDASSEHAQKATEWMVAFDTNHVLDSTRQGNDHMTSIVQRYTMAALFFATHPHETPRTILATPDSVVAAEEEKKEEDVVVVGQHNHPDHKNRRLQGEVPNLWMTSAHICEWQGIECMQETDDDSIDDTDNVYRQVIHIDLSNCNLQGTLPVELAWLLNHNELLRLDLSHNQLQGHLPPLTLNTVTDEPTTTMVSCQLEFLYLQNNSFSGTLPDDYLGKYCQGLYHVDLSDNNFSGTLPSTLYNLSHLQRLDLHGNDLSGSLPSNLFPLSHRLSDLRLTGNRFTGSIPSSLADMTLLQVLQLGNNQFHGTLATDLFHRLNKLVELDLHNCSLYGTLPASVGDLPKLVHVMVDHNKFSGNLPAEWKSSNLQSLMVHNNEFHGPLPVALGTMLKDLWLNHNSFSGTIPDIAQLSRLEKAFLHDNNLSGPIPSGVFQQLSSLEYLKIQNNHLFGTIESAVCNMKHLANLNYLAADCQSMIDCKCCDQCD